MNMQHKNVVLAMMLAMTAPAAHAQDVLNEIVKTSYKTLNDTTLSLEVRKVAVFKYDAMGYLRSRVLQPSEMLSDSVNLDTLNARIRFLNEQALAMNQLVTVYQRRLKEAKPKNTYIVTSIFKQATFDHRLFNDEDTDLVLSYYKTTDYPIPFCLDCDWVKSLAFIRSMDWSKL